VRADPPVAANTNLPLPVSSFLGREQELAEADVLLRSARLLTVTGPGGAGKTRFALELARRAREERPSADPFAVCSCFLASLKDPTLVLSTIAQTLAVSEQPGSSALDALVSHLEGTDVLLLLDNAEHLLDATPELVALLERCEGLTLLVTSREVLRVRGETVYELPPLSDEEGVALFCERGLVEPSGPVRELCLRLEGLPLAIELAAARLRILTPEQLLERLTQRLDLLRAGRDADPRQRTLRATIEWSYDLLTPEEQQLFTRLSVFAGSCTLEAAEDVAGATFDSLQSLAEKSLVRARDGRYWMLATIREYAAERLLERGEADAMRERHAETALALGERAQAGLVGPESKEWLALLEAEHANLRAALAFLGETGRADARLDLMVHTGPFWCFGGRWIEGLRWLAEALSETAEQRDLRRAEALRWAASIALSYDWDLAASYAEQSLALARELGDAESVMHALKRCAWAAARQGRLDEAARLFEERMAEARSLGNEWEVALATLDLGGLALDRHDYTRALDLADEGLDVMRRLGRVDLAPIAALNRSHCLIRMGRDDEAIPAFRDAVAAAYDVHNLELLSVALGHGAALAMRRGDAKAAARYLGAAAAAHERLGTHLYGAEEELERATVASLRAELGEACFEDAQAEGRSLSLDEALTHALATS
jgi:non-specific serine/threonine protein kinase